MLMHAIRVMNAILKGYRSPPIPDKATKAVQIQYRVWPVDMDQYRHMTNSKYLFTAELSRWETFVASGLASKAFSKNGLLFILAECNAKYIKPILPMQKYTISTKTSLCQENKWVYFNHTFLEHPDDVKVGKEPTTYAVIDAKGVFKQSNGKTIKPLSQKKNLLSPSSSCPP